MIGFRLFARFQHRQNSPQHIVSFERSAKFLIYYWGTMQYATSIVLSIAYLRKARKVNLAVCKEIKQEVDDIMQKVNGVPSHLDPGYTATAMV